jgi:ADP-ribose pyrophosphatase
MADENEILYRGHALVLKKKGHWEFVERTKASGIVAILAITDAGEVVLVEQFRIPVGKRVIELPAGLAGDVEGAEAEELTSAALRELKEETGFQAETLDLITKGPPSAGLSTEVVTIFRARGLSRTGTGGGDGSEKIDVHLIPLADLDAWLDMRRRDGCLIDYKIYAALYFEHQGRTSQAPPFALP